MYIKYIQKYGRLVLSATCNGRRGRLVVTISGRITPIEEIPTPDFAVP